MPKAQCLSPSTPRVEVIEEEEQIIDGDGPIGRAGAAAVVEGASEPNRFPRNSAHFPCNLPKVLYVPHVSVRARWLERDGGGRLGNWRVSNAARNGTEGHGTRDLR